MDFKSNVVILVILIYKLCTTKLSQSDLDFCWKNKNIAIGKIAAIMTSKTVSSLLKKPHLSISMSSMLMLNFSNVISNNSPNFEQTFSCLNPKILPASAHLKRRYFHHWIAYCPAPHLWSVVWWPNKSGFIPFRGSESRQNPIFSYNGFMKKIFSRCSASQEWW